MVGPDYVRPVVSLPEHFKEDPDWKVAQPRDNALPSAWWTLFNDPRLTTLAEQAASANWSLQQAEAQYRQSQQLVQSAQSALLPVINLTGTVNRFRAATGQSVAVSGIRDLFGNAASIAWEPDLWGGVRRQIEANTANAQVSAALLQGIRLATTTNLANNYFQLRWLDAQKTLLDNTANAYANTLRITQNRYAVGVAAKTDVMEAEAQLQSARAQALHVGIQRAKLEHAIAVLIGQAPAELSLSAEALVAQAPTLPTHLPSELLERRPDIAAAERQMAKANAEIGVAKAAYYPRLNLAATNGYQTSTLETLYTAARRYWALGPAAAALTLFDGGAKHANYKQAIDQFDASVAGYRQTVLSGLQEVEDQLAALRLLAQERQTQDLAVTAANKGLALTLNQYQAGTVSYLNVMTAQTNALNSQQTALQLQAEQLLASVQLIKALGGGWQQQQLPDEDSAAGKTTWTDYLIFPVD
jgi:NodT family efflux transporter outer membrane factor (OMF) lipoprotein